ncbi:MAG TPA: CaiB/BaiF CoA-transferase family protein [Amycolatopsis sp.]|jgi:crotonobetainyl-CoA:carnitine CoA-transferase CaiB-like acyl-CoA transferase|nr:CaiB/BaiF CoA-transferase family protein [Amycolatopsis sp.]
MVESRRESAREGSAGSGPLSGLRVVEQGAFITGPYASMLLADLGADVIKVEKPGIGDAFRVYDGTMYASTFQAFNHNKRAITIDNKNPDDQRILDELIKSADVYIHNFRVGAAERLNVGAERLLELNRRLIYCAISGLGADGPYAKRPSYDTVAQAYSGMLSMTLDPIAPKISGPAVADAVTGLYAAQGILAALVRRGIDGKGHVVEISMLEAMSHFLIEPYASYFRSGQEPGAYGRAASSQSFALVCSDGEVVALHLSSPQKFWLGALKVAGLERLADDPRFAVRVDRIVNHEQLRLEFQDVFAKQPRDHWLRELVAADVPHAPVLKLADALRDPQFAHLRLAVEAVHPSEGTVRTIRSPYRFDGRIETEVLAPPTLGEHDVEVRAELNQRTS